MTAVTDTTSPCPKRMPASVPVAGAGTSMATFDVSTTSTVSSILTKSPSPFSQDAIVAFSWSISNFGMINGIGMSHLVFARHDGADFAFDVLFLRHGSALQPATVGDGNVLARQTARRRIHVIEGPAASDRRNNFAGPAACLACFVHHQQP